MVYAFVDNTVNPPIFGLENAFLLLFMVIVGGSGRHPARSSARCCSTSCHFCFRRSSDITTLWCSAY